MASRDQTQTYFRVREWLEPARNGRLAWVAGYVEVDWEDGFVDANLELSSGREPIHFHFEARSYRNWEPVSAIDIDKLHKLAAVCNEMADALEQFNADLPKRRKAQPKREKPDPTHRLMNRGDMDKFEKKLLQTTGKLVAKVAKAGGKAK
jgi:hypothetical protein